MTLFSSLTKTMSPTPEKVSVVLSTYNMPEWLSKSVWGFACQSLPPHEVLIADDGSRDETRQTIERLRRETKLNIHHVWHEDDGFQKCRILNRAVEQASGDYLLFSDGDCIPRHDFIEQHAPRGATGALPIRWLLQTTDAAESNESLKTTFAAAERSQSVGCARTVCHSHIGCCGSPQAPRPRRF